MSNTARLAWVGAALLMGCGADVVDTSDGWSSRSPIIGGSPAESAQLYSTVAILDTESWEPECTGTLIAPTVVVTAAHCTVMQDEQTNEITYEKAPADLLIAAGVMDAMTAPDPALYDVATIVRRTDYNWNIEPDPQGVGASHDVALLLLLSPIDTLPPAPILPMSLVDSKLQDGTPLIVTGYGSRDNEGTLFGQLYYAETPYHRRTDFEFIAGGPGSPDTCPGDSGGPAYLSSDGTTSLVGATSRAVSTSTQNCGDGGIYGLLPAYDTWLSETSGGAYQPTPPPQGTGGGAGAPNTNPPPSGGGSEDKGGCSHTGSPKSGFPALAALVLLGWITLRRKIP